MSNVETKRIRHTKYVQFMLEVEELVRNGWSFVPAGSTNFGVQLIANFERSVKQGEKITQDVVEKNVDAGVINVDKPADKVTPVKATVKPSSVRK